MRHYQRGRASITGLRLESGKIIETERLVVVARCGFIGFLIPVCSGSDFDACDMRASKWKYVVSAMLRKDTNLVQFGCLDQNGIVERCGRIIVENYSDGV